MTEEEKVETQAQRFAKRLAQESAELDDPMVKAQLQLDHWWQRRLEAEAVDDGYDYSTGFAERKRRTTCHRGKGDPDFGL